MHGGHTNKVSDISWNPHEPWTMCSVAEDNICQMWQVANTVYRLDEGEVVMTEAE